MLERPTREIFKRELETEQPDVASVFTIIEREAMYDLIVDNLKDYFFLNIKNEDQYEAVYEIMNADPYHSADNMWDETCSFILIPVNGLRRIQYILIAIDDTRRLEDDDSEVRFNVLIIMDRNKDEKKST